MSLLTWSLNYCKQGQLLKNGYVYVHNLTLIFLSIFFFSSTVWDRQLSGLQPQQDKSVDLATSGLLNLPFHYHNNFPFRINHELPNNPSCKIIWHEKHYSMDSKVNPTTIPDKTGFVTQRLKPEIFLKILGSFSNFNGKKKKNCDKFYDFIGALSGWKASAHHGMKNTQDHIRKAQ